MCGCGCGTCDEAVLQGRLSRKARLNGVVEDIQGLLGPVDPETGKRSLGVIEFEMTNKGLAQTLLVGGVAVGTGALITSLIK